MIDIFIIGIQGQLRSKSLDEWASSVDCRQRITFVNPVFCNRSQVPRLLEIYTFLHYGNRLTVGEWGCSMAHLRAQILALSMSSEWALFLEDDATLSDHFTRDLERLVFLLPLNKTKPVGVHCFGPRLIKAGSGDQVELRFRSGLPPVGTVGYLLNRVSLELAKQTQHKGHPIGKADFPAWSCLVEWAEAHPSIVFHEEGSASIVGPRILASRQRGRLFKFAHAVTRILLFLLPIVKIQKRLEWELDFILKPVAELSSQLSRRGTS